MASEFRTFPLLLVLLLALDRIRPTLCEEVTLLDTSKMDGNLGWLSEPPNGWELAQEMVNGTPIHMYRDCMLSPGSSGEHWLRSSWIHQGEARRVFVELSFTVRDCGSLEPGPGSACRETFNLYYLATARDYGVRFQPAQFSKIGTLAADQSFTDRDVRAGRARLNMEQRSFEPGPSQTGFYLALQNVGACVALVRTRLSYRRCPATRRGLATFPATVCAPATLLEVVGTCGDHALPRGHPRLHCGHMGSWLVAVDRCVCEGGYQEDAGECRACLPGYYKESVGDSACARCPSRSNSEAENSTSCSCNEGFYRARGESPDQPCTGPPSAPQNSSALILGSKVTLSWLPPLDSGGRKDLTYTVSCERCSWEPDPCVPCEGSLTAQPGWGGLRDPWVIIEGLEAFGNYTFSIVALNGVSDLAEAEERGRGNLLPLLVAVSEGVGAPPAVAEVTILRREETSLSVAWQPTERRGRGIMGYEVMYQQQGREQIYTVKKLKDNQVTLTELRPATVYLLKVRVQTPLGAGAYSPIYQFETLSPEVEQHSYLIIVSCVFGTITLVVLLAVLIWVRRSSPFLSFPSPTPPHSLCSARNTQSKTRESSCCSNSDREKVPLRMYQDLHDYEDPREAFLNFTDEIENSYLVTENVIGEGEFGEVYRGTLKYPEKERQAVAIKTLKTTYSDTQWWNFLREATIMGQFDHPNIIQLQGVVTKRKPMMLVTEYMENGALDSFLQENDGKFSPVQLAGMLLGIASGMKYLSDRSYVHRDLAARNILVGGSLECKVSDFGLSRVLQDDPEGTYETRGGKIPIRWTAPEAIALRTFTSASDVWSYGILMWEVMSFGEKPYGEMSNQQVMKEVEDGFRLPAPHGCPTILYHLMKTCWHQDKRKRPTFSDILSELDKMMSNPASLKPVTDFNSRETLRLPSNSGSEGIPYRSIAEWLEALRMKRYVEVFTSGGFETMESILEIGLEDLKSMAISLPGHQKRILCSIQGFKE